MIIAQTVCWDPTSSQGRLSQGKAPWGRGRLGPGSAMGGKKAKKRSERHKDSASEASRAVDWGGGRAAFNLNLFQKQHQKTRPLWIVISTIFISLRLTLLSITFKMHY